VLLSHGESLLTGLDLEWIAKLQRILGQWTCLYFNLYCGS